MNKVFVDHLPKWGGVTGKINWRESVGESFRFIYENFEGEFKIINYSKINKLYYITLLYDGIEHHMTSGKVLAAKFGFIVGKYNNKHIYSVGEIINTNSGAIEILDKIRMGKNNARGYKYKCLKCSNLDTFYEYQLKKNTGCNVCDGKKVLVGYNDIHTVNPYLGTLLKQHEDGYKYTVNSNKRVDFVCPECKNIIENKSICNVQKNNLSCPNCSDGISYPEKVIGNLLKQVGVVYEAQKTIENKRYDFYILSLNCIIETHGIQHFKEAFSYCGGRTLQEEQDNDNEKIKLAKKNNIIEYIVLDCSKSEISFIKNKVLERRLADLIELNSIDWNKCHESALKSVVKEVCGLWKNEVQSANEIARRLKLSSYTVIKYLKQGALLGWCTYVSRIKKRRTRNEMQQGNKIY
ncbi:MAG: hypothetical protein ACXVA0_24080 [Mucilaginibacter sp.]